jgi:putative transcriptional regulator
MQRSWLVKYRGNKTQEEAAKLSKISRSAYSNIESGNRDPSVQTAKKIAQGLGFEWKIFFEENCFDTKSLDRAVTA